MMSVEQGNLGNSELPRLTTVKAVVTICRCYDGVMVLETGYNMCWTWRLGLAYVK